ncbi:hypothetical protein [uncultured Ruminococcus sp.]|uniref:hypothetical protein n=1 Tax=uncultured Ruminococcus sp. TaxID=165186 RepID=UPI0025CCF9BB|nr:hypothetical protein [uncultured Ruminococcus sp.]
MNTKRIAVSLLGSLLIFFNCIGFSAFAETALPSGAVKGLPERLAALDDEGNAVNSETGEYFFHVEDMDYGRTYTKNIQLMNLREDATYHIYFYVEPLYKAGEIDLEKGCTCRFYLDGDEIYSGDVNGKGNIDLTTQHFDCGYYSPGETHTLRCEIVWNDLDVLKNVDNGWKLVDKDGIHTLVGPDGEGYVEGEIEFKWIFYAQIDEPETEDDSNDARTPPDTSSDDQEGTTSENNDGTYNGGGGSGNGTNSSDGFFPPYTGILMKDGRVWLISMGVIGVMIGVLLVMIKRKDRKK